MEGWFLWTNELQILYRLLKYNILLRVDKLLLWCWTLFHGWPRWLIPSLSSCRGGQHHICVTVVDVGIVLNKNIWADSRHNKSAICLIMFADVCRTLGLVSLQLLNGQHLWNPMVLGSYTLPTLTLHLCFVLSYHKASSLETLPAFPVGLLLVLAYSTWSKHALTWCTGSSSHLRTALPKSSSRTHAT